MLEMLRADPAGFLLQMLYRAPAVLLALTLHELAHGYVALRCGDPTAKMAGRLTLNPIRHLDPVGTISLFLFGFGWARPVPVNPNNYRNGWKDDLKVSLAGVTTNFILFLLFTLVSILLGRVLYTPLAAEQLGTRFFLSLEQSGFYMQLDPKYAEALRPVIQVPWLLHLQRFVLHSCVVNLGLSLFNLLPIPPLDGFHVVNDIFLQGRLRLTGQIFRVAQVVLIVLMFTTNILGRVVSAMMQALQGGVLSLLGV